MRWLRSSASRRRASDSITFDKCLGCWDHSFGAEILPLVHIVIMGPTCHKIAITKKNRILLGIFHELKKLRFKHVSQFHFLFCLKSIWWCQKCQSQCSKNEWLAKWWYHIFSFYFPNDWGVGIIWRQNTYFGGWFFSAQPPTRLENGYVLAMGLNLMDSQLKVVVWAASWLRKMGSQAFCGWVGVGRCQVGARKGVSLGWLKLGLATVILLGFFD